MKNVVILCVVLVYASLVSAGFFTPSSRSKDDVRVVNKEGVVIGIEDDNGNTKVKISPSDHEVDEKGVFASAKEKIKDAASGVVPEAMKKKGEDQAEETVKGGIGKVKDRVAQATQKASESVEEAASEVSGKAKDKMNDIKGGVKEKGKAAQEKVKTQGKKGVKRVFWYLVSPGSLSGVLHLLGFSTAYGMCVWVTFGSNYVLGKALPRQQLAMVQSKVYPLYFKAMASSVGMALVGYMMEPRRKFSPLGLGIFRGIDLLASLTMVLANLLYLEPRATKVLFERMRKEKEEGGDADVAEGKKPEEAEAVGGGKMQNVRNVLLKGKGLNSYSSMLNIATLMSLTWHLVNLGQHVHAEC